jgi:hypothetical protein
LGFEVISVEFIGNEGVDNGDTEFPVLWFVSKLWMDGLGEVHTPITMIRVFSMMFRRLVFLL